VKEHLTPDEAITYKMKALEKIEKTCNDWEKSIENEEASDLLHTNYIPPGGAIIGEHYYVMYKNGTWEEYNLDDAIECVPNFIFSLIPST
jgi:hypothetical protein